MNEGPCSRLLFFFQDLFLLVMFLDLGFFLFDFRFQLVEELVDALVEIEALHTEMYRCTPSEIDRRLHLEEVFLPREVQHEIHDKILSEIQARHFGIEVVLYIFGDFKMDSLDFDVHVRLLEYDDSMASSPRYLATVLRAREMPRAARISTILWSERPPARAPDAAAPEAPTSAPSCPMISLMTSFTPSLEKRGPALPVPATELEKKCFNLKIPHSVCTYFDEVMRETVASCTPISPAMSFSVRGLMYFGPLRKNSRW